MLTGRDIPVNAFRSSLYTRFDLLSGFDCDDPRSYERTLDFQAYQFFVSSGKRAVTSYEHSIVESLHDNSMTQALLTFLQGRRVVGFMGGHDVDRDSQTYRNVAVLAKRIAEANFVVTTGGGPGAMEAGHAGAFYANEPASVLEHALAALAQQPTLPSDLGQILFPDGTVRYDLLEALHAWQAVAERLVSLGPSSKDRAPSLGVPTWLYGHEPPTPFADYTAKYFQNSIREDGLLAIANHGVVFVEGRAGTFQEVFQIANQNYYLTEGPFRPMIFLGREFWTRSGVVEVLRALFSPADFSRFVLVTDDLEEAYRLLLSYGT